MAGITGDLARKIRISAGTTLLVHTVSTYIPVRPLVGEFGISVNPIPSTRGADYAHPITACPPGFENLTASLHTNILKAKAIFKRFRKRLEL
jgi:hypothetical protein